MKKAFIDLKRLRGEIVGKQCAIAAKLGVSQVSISRWARGVNPLPLARLNQICEVLERDVTDFLIIE